MQPAGDELLAHWREIGEWWAGESPREYRRFVDSMGVIREREHCFQYPVRSHHQERLSRFMRIRDEKVAKAMGYAPKPDYESFRHDDIHPEPAALLFAQSGCAFGRSTMHVQDILSFPEAQTYQAALLADPFSLVGAHDFAKVAREIGATQALIGASFEMEGGGELVLIAKTKLGYRNLSHLITVCHQEEPRLFPLCTWERLERFRDDLVCLTGGDNGPINRLVTRGDLDAAWEYLQRLSALYGRENLFVQIERCYLPWEIRTNRTLLDLAEKMRLLPVAGNRVHHHMPGDFSTQDMLVCIETLCGIDEVVGRKPMRDPSQPPIVERPRRDINAERYLRDVFALRELFADRPDLIDNTMKIARECDADVLPPRTELPRFCEDENEKLRRIVMSKANRLRKRYRIASCTRRHLLQYELDRITRRGFAGHYLIAWDMCRWAKSQDIVFSGRGSVVDSAVAYCLGLSRIDAYEHDLHFDRFLPDDGSKRPDIDIDFEARRRDDVRNYLAQRYGPDHVATVGAIGTYNTRGIVRECGKVLGIPAEDLSYLAKRIHGSVSPARINEAIDSKPELRNSSIPRERFHLVFELAKIMQDIPRNLRSHSSGVVISRTPIADTVPVVPSAVEDVRIIQWDKRSSKHYFDKFDILCLRGNDVLSDAMHRISSHSPDFSIFDLPLNDPDVYATMRAGALIGIPQSASPAMRQAHIRIKTQNLKEASLVQAGIRPGVGGAVKLNELILRKNKKKPVPEMHELLEEILGKTYGLIVFQEQVDMLLQKFGGYSAGEAEEIREDIYKRRREKDVVEIYEKVLGRFLDRGHPPHVAEEVYNLVAQFQGYGFAEGHALAFAEISVRSIYCQQNFPTEYFAALLDAQPAGYYPPRTLVNEARNRNVRILPPDVNVSGMKYGVEDILVDGEPILTVPNNGIRISLREIQSVSTATLERIVEKRGNIPYGSFFDFVARVRPNRDELEWLIFSGALDRLHPNRRAMLWAIPRALKHAASLQDMSDALNLHLPEPNMPEGVADFNIHERAIQESETLGLDVEQHLMAFERDRVRAKGGVTAAEAGRLLAGSKAIVVGNPIRLRFPPTESGKRVLFFDLEDESGLLNVTCFDDTYQRYGHNVICCQYVAIRGEAQDRDGHIAFLASHIFPYRPDIEKEVREDIELPIKRADFLVT